MDECDVAIRPLTKRGRKARERTAFERERDDQRWIDARRAKLAAAKKAPATFTVIPRHVWELAALCMGDRSGRAAWWHLSRVRNRAAIGAIRRAAFAGDARAWTSGYALRVTVLGLCMLELGEQVRRPSRWRQMFEGIPREALCALLRDPITGHVPSVTALTGTHRADGNLENAQIGWLKALRVAGFCYRLQRRQCEYEPSCNQYWIIDSRGLGHAGAAVPGLLELVHESYELEHTRPGRAPPIAV